MASCVSPRQSLVPRARHAPWINRSRFHTGQFRDVPDHRQLRVATRGERPEVFIFARTEIPATIAQEKAIAAKPAARIILLVRSSIHASSIRGDDRHNIMLPCDRRDRERLCGRRARTQAFGVLARDAEKAAGSCFSASCYGDWFTRTITRGPSNFSDRRKPTSDPFVHQVTKQLLRLSKLLGCGSTQ